MARSVIAALAVGLALITITAIVTLARSPLTTAGTNSIPGSEYLELKTGLSTCQPAGKIPRGTSAIRVGVEGRSANPAVTLRVLTGSRILREGQQIAGFGATPTVTVPVRPLANAVDGARICTTVRRTPEPIRFYGTPTNSSGPNANQPQTAVLHMEYLRPDPKSWWSLAPSIAHHMGLGHAPSGTWVAFLVLALMLAVVTIVSQLTLKELR
jgi:hypothetical protein